MSKTLTFLIAILALFAAQAIFLWDFGIDDVGISYRYAQHLADGHGLNWNLEGPRVEGYSNFLWVLILAAARWIGIDIVLASKALGMVLGAVNLWLLWVVCRRLWCPARFWWLPVLLVAMTPEWTAWSMSGLELALIGLFLLAALVALTGDRWQRIWLLSAAAAGLVLTRPEGPILAVVLLVAGWFTDRDQTLHLRVKTYSLPVLALLVAGLGLLIFRLIYFGVPMPNTVYAKFSLALPSKARVFEWLLFALPFFIVWAMTLAMRQDRRHRWTLRACLALVVIQMIIVLPVNPVMYLLHRYQIPLLPLLVLPVPFVLRELNRRRRWLSAVVAIFLFGWTLQGWPSIYERLRLERSFMSLQWQVVELLNRLPDRPVIAIGDAGRIPYWTDLTTFDVWGLCDTEIAHEGFTSELALRRSPDVYILAVSIMADGDYYPFFGFDRIIWNTPRFRNTYGHWKTCERDPEAVARGWAYDYGLFIRGDWAVEHGFMTRDSYPGDRP